MLAGGLFLVWKATTEIHHHMQGKEEEATTTDASCCASLSSSESEIKSSADILAFTLSFYICSTSNEYQ
jgi:hypothetical protein